ncbi:hypothetical protein JCM15519_16440 [Fundidesulfovibrio butyratiphilus]
MEASSALGEASQITLLQTLKARVVTTAIGFRIGPLGVDYSSQRVELDPDKQDSGQSGQPSLDQTYQQAKARFEAAADQTHIQSIAASHPDHQWRKGLSAYAKAQGALADSTPTLVTVA